MINAIEVALMEGASRVEIEHFATAFDTREGRSPGDEVFRSPRWSQIDVDALGRT